MKRYQDKVVFTTGSSTGIGYATAKRMAQEGATVIISSRKQANVDEAVQNLKKEGLNAVGFPCHVGDKLKRQELFKYIQKEFGRLDVLVLNAAISINFGSVFDTTEEIYDKTMDINLKSVFFTVLELKPLMPLGKKIFI